MVRRSIALLGILLLGACDGGNDRVVEVEEPVALSGGPATLDATDGAPLPGSINATPDSIRPSSPANDGEAAGEPTTSSATVPAPSAPSNEAPAVGEEADDILERAERAYDQVRSMEADFAQQVFVPLLDTTIASSGKLYHQAPDRFAMRFSDPQGDLIVADGSYVWMYHPSTNERQVMRSRLGAGGQQVDLQREFLSDASSRYNATRTGMESVGGRDAHALTLVPRGPSPYKRIRIWVDARDFLVRRFEITEENDSVRRLDLSNLRPNATVPAGVFQFTPPANAQIYEP